MALVRYKTRSVIYYINWGYLLVGILAFVDIFIIMALLLVFFGDL